MYVLQPGYNFSLYEEFDSRFQLYTFFQREFLNYKSDYVSFTFSSICSHLILSVQLLLFLVFSFAFIFTIFFISDSGLVRSSSCSSLPSTSSLLEEKFMSILRNLISVNYNFFRQSGSTQLGNFLFILPYPLYYYISGIIGKYNKSRASGGGISKQGSLISLQ